MTTRSGGSRLTKNVLLALVSTLFAIGVVGIVGEVVVRKREVTRDSPPGTMPVLYYRHARLGHALVRNYDYFGWVRVNGHGFRGEPVSTEKPPGTVRLMAVGGSTTFDSQVSGDDRTWPARLEHWLREALPEGPEIQVVNAGGPGYRVVDSSIRFITELHRFCPDIVLLYQAHNDLIAALRASQAPKNPLGSVQRAARPDQTETTTPWTAWLERHSLLYAKFRARWRAIQDARRRTRQFENAAGSVPDLDPHFDREAGRVWVGRVSAGADMFETNLRFFAALVGSLEAELVIPEVTYMSHGEATQPEAMREALANTYGVPIPVVARGYDAFNEVARRVAEETVAHHVPTREFGLGGFEWYAEGDAIHFNDEGSDRMARALAEALVSSGLVERARDPIACD